MNENSNCQLCELHSTCNPKSVCLKGRGGMDAKMVIFLDSPGIVEDKRSRGMVGEGAELLLHLLSKMSIPAEHVYIDYILRCYPKANKNIGKKAFRAEMIEACSVYRVATLQLLRPYSVVVMGAIACEAFLGSEKVSNFEGSKWTPNEPIVREYVSDIWVTYAPAYALKSPAEIVSIYRTLFAAAIDAKLKPKFDKKKAHYDYGF